MVTGQAYYVRGQQVDFPFGRRWISGPYDSVSDCIAARARLAPLYPDANLETAIRRGKSLPVATPRGAQTYDLSRVAGRRAAADAIAAHVAALGLDAEMRDDDGDPTVTARTPNLNASIWMVPGERTPIISWYGARFPLRGLPGAWLGGNVNPFHRCKATTLPASWPELFDALEIGLLGSLDGSAFLEIE